MGRDDEVLNVFRDFLDNEEYIDNRDNDIRLIPRDYFNKESIEAIETHREIFRDIPKTDLIHVFIGLSEVLAEYYKARFFFKLDSIKEAKLSKSLIFGNPNIKITNQTVINHLKTPTLIVKDFKPSTEIKKDIKTIKNFYNLYNRTLGNNLKIKYKGQHPFLNDLETFENGIKLLLNDLEKKEFKIIRKSHYYMSESPSKKIIFNFLNDIKAEYNLQVDALSIKQLADSI